MTEQNRWFIEERAIAFVSLLLTKNGEAAIQRHTGRDKGLDLLVEILRGGKSTMRFFAVQVAAYLDMPSASTINETIASDLQREPVEMGLPLAIFVIGVRGPEGMYRWLVEPVVEEGRARLRRAETGVWQTLDEAEMTGLIDRVNSWYELLNGDSLPKTPGQRTKMPS